MGSILDTKLSDYQKRGDGTGGKVWHLGLSGIVTVRDVISRDQRDVLAVDNVGIRWLGPYLMRIADKADKRSAKAIKDWLADKRSRCPHCGQVIQRRDT